MQETLLIFDFGSQYTQLIARRVRELNVFCEIYPYNKKIPEHTEHVKGVILSGSPFSVYDAEAPTFDFTAFKGKTPILAVCYGAQLIAQQFGGSVLRSQIREYGRANLSYVCNESLFRGIDTGSQVWMSHGDTISAKPTDSFVTASTNHVEIAGFKINNEPTYGIQFHPEVYHTTQGALLLKNFVVDICGFTQSWTPDSFVESTIKELQQTLKDDKVILGLSGGIDSSVAAMLLHKAIGKNLHCIFIDNGLLRKNEFNNVLESFSGYGLNIIGIDAKNDFYRSLKGISDPEGKRKAIGKTFIEVFEREALKITDARWLAQGTIYPDVIESISVKGPSATIKSHHNVGGLPEKMHLKVVEPLKFLFKDEVRKVGMALQISEAHLKRHPFPGPGLGIRILGEITPEKVGILQEADAHFIDGLIEFKLYDKVWQAATILLPVKSVGVMGDERTYENTICLRAVTSTDGMTADWAHLPYEFLAEISNRIINSVKGVNRVVYDISSKPPATIEWE
ncbi:MAG: GMP synthase (glutamine-hydrolyzing) [Bacteroidetes bacterium ADurb.Bin408]|nr:MAG: GMP synthase (glutamine-hydrolyzing) [Bacteroidetes bacterium ADurb.Bin408]